MKTGLYHGLAGKDIRGRETSEAPIACLNEMIALKPQEKEEGWHFGNKE